MLLTPGMQPARAEVPSSTRLYGILMGALWVVYVKMLMGTSLLIGSFIGSQVLFFDTVLTDEMGT